MGSFFISSATSLRSGRVRRSQRTYLVRFIPVRRLWRKQHGDEHLGEQEAERRSNFVHLKKSFFQIIPTNVQHCTWLGFFLPPAVRDFRQEKSHGRVGERTRKKRFLFRLQCPYFLVIFDQVRERTWLDSSLWQKDLLFKAGLSCISENHLAIMRRRNSFWNVHKTRAAGHGIYTATNALIRDGCGEFSMFSQMPRIGHNQ